MSNTHYALRYPVKNHETNFDLKDNSYVTTWITEHDEKFVTPKVERQKIGKKRELLIKYFKVRACKEALEENLDTVPDSTCSSEYKNKFCNESFIPFFDKSTNDIQNFNKYPLNNGQAYSFYKEQFDKGNIKMDSEFRNINNPFVKRSLFTTPLDLAWEEPINGF